MKSRKMESELQIGVGFISIQRAPNKLHRKLNNGMVPSHDVVGKAFVVVWPFDRAGGLGVPASVFGRVPDPPAQ